MTPTTARILQVSPTETITYDMPYILYELMKDVMDGWSLYHSRRDKCTVEKVIALMERVMPRVKIRELIEVKREPTKPEIRGLRADVWLDPYGFSKETT
jgi:hypothetical protein